MVLEYNCWKHLSTSNGFPQQNGFGIPVRWWWWTTVLMMRLKILETISTAKWFWSTTHRNHFHSKMVLDYDSQKPFTQQNSFGIPVRWWWWTTVLMMRLKIPRLVRFVLFGFIWGCRKQLCWDLCTITAPQFNLTNSI